MAMTLPTLELFDVVDDGNKERRMGVSRCVMINRFFSLTDKAPPSKAKGPGFKSCLATVAKLHILHIVAYFNIFCVYKI